jgi:DNA-binding transcriptional regulator YiaG
MTDTDAADEIKAWRDRPGCTQEQAAEALGVPVQTVRAWEIGRYLPRHRRLLTLALAQVTSQQSKQTARPIAQRRFRARQ